ncbi:MAG: apolipoprotein N-acyltransferase, partial [bacterium]|nr:apolipoprotein N-acyltransferase [bacterium]
MRIAILLLSLLSALLYILASPPLNLEPLGWIALTPLIYAVDKCLMPKDAFKAGMAAGMLAYSGLCYWFIGTMMSFGGMSFAVSLLFFLFLAAYMALYWALFAYLLKRASLQGVSVLIAAPSLWASLEYLRTYLFTGHPWALLGYTQYKNISIIQLSDITGVYGISFILALFSAAVYEFVRRHRLKNSFPLKEAALLLAALLIPLSYGSIKISNYKEPRRVLRAALIQGNIEQGVKWNEEYKEKTVDIYRTLSEKAHDEAGGLDIIVWPETAVPFYYQQTGSLTRKVMALSKDLDTPILFGSPAYKYENRKVGYLNSAFLIAPTADKRSIETIGRYDKYHLVPFGEYVPLGKYLFFMNKITAGIGDFVPGKGVMTLDMAGREPGGPHVSYGPLICYEGIFPDLVRRFVKKGANVLVNITNDAWYGRSSAPYQHLSAIAFRSVENGVYTLRAANTGVTAIIDPLGRIEGETEIFKEAFLTGKIGLADKRTIYTSYGDIFALTISLLSFFLIFFAPVRAGFKA